MKNNVASFNKAVNRDKVLQTTDMDRRNVLMSFLKGKFMQVSMLRIELEGNPYTLVHDNLVVFLNRTSQENIGCDFVWLMYSKNYQQRRAHNIACYSAVEVDCMLREARELYMPTAFSQKWSVLMFRSFDRRIAPQIAHA